ncbi:PDR/VanB family oxidoreductase [Streptomyces caniscabiei]|uniref:PDR/VanB family oxidoreductase n=1 Tax=Streptomyces caniscabiei TaxID=2746961 RepID=UPI0029A539C2|nr:PDR/VanB family oxidoreductase [Streptomyces caniscabiei]MDX2600313.1 PDR/VanB family oxidoreductase [Streptomyces caniscabiei]
MSTQSAQVRTAAEEQDSARERTTPAEERQVTITRRREVAAGIVELTLAAGDPAVSPLEGWEPGAHIDIVLPSGTVRQYSLCGHPERPLEYRIAVLREPEGRGGSAEVHDGLFEGMTVVVRGPRNHFRLAVAERYLFLAGGIGVTPILAMVREAAATGTPWTLIYGGRTRASMAYTEELIELAALSQGEVLLVPQDERGHPDFAAAFGGAPEGTAVYACGPEPMLQAAEAFSEQLLAPGALHLERFGAKPQDADDAAAASNTPFEVELARSGRTLTVPADRRLIDVVREVVPQVPFSCEEGYCGSCETGVLDGIPDHRDQVLTPDERDSNETMMICVGRCLSRKLTLDL